MTTRFFRLLACQLLLLFACAQALAADTVDILHAHIEATDEGYKLDAKYSFDLTHDLEDALQAGIRLSFTTEIELTRPRWYWTDDKAIAERRTVTIGYNPLIRKYNVQVVGQYLSELCDAGRSPADDPPAGPLGDRAAEAP